jgi:hypothetical protein
MEIGGQQTPAGRAAMERALGRPKLKTHAHLGALQQIGLSALLLHVEGSGWPTSIRHKRVRVQKWAALNSRSMLI